MRKIFNDSIQRKILSTLSHFGIDKKQTFYCYSEAEKQQAIQKLRGKAEITRFKGLGEISADEFQHFIGKEIRLEPVTLQADDHIQQLLAFYMGKNTQDRQNFIIDNLLVEKNAVAAS